MTDDVLAPLIAGNSSAANIDAVITEVRRLRRLEPVFDIAKELAEKHVRGKGACTACGAAAYMGTMTHNGGCPVSRLAAIT